MNIFVKITLLIDASKVSTKKSNCVVRIKIIPTISAFPFSNSATNDANNFYQSTTRKKSPSRQKKKTNIRSEKVLRAASSTAKVFAFKNERFSPSLNKLFKSICGFGIYIQLRVNRNGGNGNIRKNTFFYRFNQLKMYTNREIIFVRLISIFPIMEKIIISNPDVKYN